MSKDRFALVYEAEFAVLRNLSSNAVKVFIWFKMGGARKRAAGCRQVAADAGLSRAQAARAMGELCAAGLMKLASKGEFGAKRRVSEYEIPSAKKALKAKTQSHPRDYKRPHSLTRETMGARTVSPARLSGELQSHGRDTINTPRALPSGQEARGVNKDKSGIRRVSDLAAQLQLPLMTLMMKTDGPKGADFLARKLQRGELSLDDVRQRLAQPPVGSAKEPDNADPHERKQPGSDKPLVMVA